MAVKKVVQEDEKEIRVSEHMLVPKHEVIGKDEKASLLKKFNITEQQLPKIAGTDPALKDIGAKTGDIIKIMRKSPTAGKTLYYRYVTGAVHAD